MKPLQRLNTIVFSCTTAAVFFLWGVIQSLVNSNPVYGVFLGFIIALGTYRAILQVILLSSRLTFVKRLIFGPYFLEGTWIGCYITGDGTPAYYIEEFDQDFDNLVIKGRAYLENGSFRGSWVSDNVSIDVLKGIITYTYSTNFIHNSHVNIGLANFITLRKKARKAPYCLMGFSSDLYNDAKTKAIELKVSNKKRQNEKLLINAAKELYAEHKDFYI